VKNKMSETAVFVGWGGTHPGREELARKTFAEFVEILEELKAEGEIEGFETVLLAPHGGELDGFTLVHGEPEKLIALPLRADLHRLQMRAMLDHAKFSIIPATIGEGVERELTLFHEIVAEYSREAGVV
jgi:hypothetical protein